MATHAWSPHFFLPVTEYGGCKHGSDKDNRLPSEASEQNNTVLNDADDVGKILPNMSDALEALYDIDGEFSPIVQGFSPNFTWLYANRRLLTYREGL